ncbi:MAG: hypothetical protein ACYTGA_13450 [Planctomycetota bacterium]|jgi:DNA-directed RNA polymerase subunit RPC12/RpoP
MPISFHCQSCKKQIKAPDATGGKWGNCPYCNHRCYIPLPKSDDEPELVLLPLDESDETQIAELMQETKNLTKEILSQGDLPDEESAPAGGNRTANEKEIIKLCILYLRQMADGELGAAEHTFPNLHGACRAAGARAGRPTIHGLARPDQGCVHKTQLIFQ